MKTRQRMCKILGVTEPTVEPPAPKASLTNTYKTALLALAQVVAIENRKEMRCLALPICIQEEKGCEGAGPSNHATCRTCLAEHYLLRAQKQPGNHAHVTPAWRIVRESLPQLDTAEAAILQQIAQEEGCFPKS